MHIGRGVLNSWASSADQLLASNRVVYDGQVAVTDVDSVVPGTTCCA